MKSLFSKVKNFLTVGKFSVIMMILGVIGISFMYYVLTYTRILTVPVFLTCVLGIFALAVSEIYCLVILFKYLCIIIFMIKSFFGGLLWKLLKAFLSGSINIFG